MKEPAGTDPGPSCTVRFVTKLPELVPDHVLSVPSSVSVQGLSDLVNHLIDRDPPIDYDFLVDGAFLRTSLADYVSGAGLSFESALTVEVTHRHPAPAPESPRPHPDWISSVAVVGSLVYTGCYDHTVRQWSPGPGQASLAPLAGHTGPVKCVAASSCAIVTGSKDRTVRLWSPDALAPVAVGAGHTDSVECVALCPSSPDLFASGSWDRTVRLWGRSDGPAAPATKKSRRSKAGAPALRELSCLADVHTQNVSGLCWPEPGALYSVSWDRSLRRVDANDGAVVRTWALPDAASSVAFSADANLVAVGQADRAVRLYDPRQSGAAVKTFAGHQTWVSDVAWAPRSASMFVSGSYDGMLKLWDMRAPSPLHTLRADSGPGAKTLAVDWGGDGVIAAGGTDGQLRLHRSQL